MSSLVAPRLFSKPRFAVADEAVAVGRGSSAGPTPDPTWRDHCKRPRQRSKTPAAPFFTASLLPQFPPPSHPLSRRVGSIGRLARRLPSPLPRGRLGPDAFPHLFLAPLGRRRLLLGAPRRDVARGGGRHGGASGKQGQRGERGGGQQGEGSPARGRRSGEAAVGGGNKRSTASSAAWCHGRGREPAVYERRDGRVPARHGKRSVMILTLRAAGAVEPQRDAQKGDGRSAPGRLAFSGMTDSAAALTSSRREEKARARALTVSNRGCPPPHSPPGGRPGARRRSCRGERRLAKHSRRGLVDEVEEVGPVKGSPGSSGRRPAVAPRTTSNGTRRGGPSFGPL